jgi:hypothetical protein
MIDSFYEKINSPELELPDLNLPLRSWVSMCRAGPQKKNQLHGDWVETKQENYFCLLQSQAATGKNNLLSK